MCKIAVKVSMLLLACFVMAPTAAFGDELEKSFNLAEGVGRLKAIKKPDLDGFKGVFKYTVPGDVASNAVLVQQLYDALDDVLDEQKEQVTDALIDVDLNVAQKLKDIEGLGPEARDAATEAKLKELSQVLNNSGKGIVENTIEDMNEAVKAKLEKLAEEETSYKWSECKFVVTIVWKTIKLSLAVARVAGTSGADVTAWVSAVKTVKDIVKEANKHSQSAESPGQ